MITTMCSNTLFRVRFLSKGLWVLSLYFKMEKRNGDIKHYLILSVQCVRMYVYTYICTHQTDRQTDRQTDTHIHTHTHTHTHTHICMQAHTLLLPPPPSLQIHYIFSYRVFSLVGSRGRITPPIMERSSTLSTEYMLQ